MSLTSSSQDTETAAAVFHHLGKTNVIKTCYSSLMELKKDFNLLGS